MVTPETPLLPPGGSAGDVPARSRRHLSRSGPARRCQWNHLSETKWPRSENLLKSGQRGGASRHAAAELRPLKG